MVNQNWKRNYVLRVAAGVVLMAVIIGHGLPVRAGGDARETFRQGVELYNEGKFDEAAKSFEQAYKLKPTYKLLFNIGQAYAAAKKYALAIQAFERYLVDGGDNVTDDRRDEVLREIGKLRPLVGFLAVDGREGLTVRVDGVDRGQTPLKSKVMLTVGHPHKVEVFDGEELVLVRELSVYGGMVETVNVSEQKEESTVAPPPTSLPVTEQTEETIDEQTESETEAVPEKKRLGKMKLIGIASLAAGGAALLAGGAFGILSLVQNSTLEKACPGGNCSPTREGEVETLGKFALATDILLGVGGAFAAAGLVLFFLPEKKEKGPADENVQQGGPEVSIVPLPGGLAADIRF